MRMYKLNTTEFVYDNPGCEPTTVDITRWFASERDAVVLRLALYKAGKLEGKKSSYEIEAWDIDTTKLGLLNFLNENCI